MFKELRRRFLERTLLFNARTAAEGTYETIRRAIIYARPQSPTEMEENILEALGSRRAWRRLDEKTFSVHWSQKEAVVSAPKPLVIGKFFRDVADAEIAVFCASADDVTMRRLQEAGRQELRRLFERDSLPWFDDEPGT